MPLAPSFTFTGKGNWSLDGAPGTSGTLQAAVPDGSTVVKAYLYATTFFGGSISSATLAGNSVTGFTALAPLEGGLPLQAFRADVTTLVAGLVGDGDPALFNFAIVNSSGFNVDGFVLAIVYSNPAEKDRTITFLDGASNPTGDTFTISYGEPLDPTEAGFEAIMSLGIGFSAGGSQSSTISVNGSTLSTIAGGADDGFLANGALITVGGIGDSIANPGASDDELYDLTPFLSAGATSTTVTTLNASGDDNIFFAGINVTAEASVAVDIPGNVAPVAVDDSATTSEDAFTTVDVLDNDTDEDSDPLSVTSVEVTSGLGSAEIVDGQVRYDPGNAYNSLAVGGQATAVVTYEISDGKGGTDSATLTVTITGANDAPDAVDDVLGGADGVGAVRVAVIGTLQSDVAGTVGQLNDDSYFDFDAVGYTVSSFGDKAQWDAVLSGYDVVVVGGSGYGSDGADGASVFASIADFAATGGGVVSTGWFHYTIVAVGGTTQALMDAISPVATGGYNAVFEPYVVTITDGSHPVTAGLSQITSGANFWETAANLDPSAISLATAGGSTAIAYDVTASDAHLLYLGGLYLGHAATYDTGPLRSGAADQLLEQGVAWAGNVQSFNEDETALIAQDLLLENDTDPDGDTLAITAVSASSARGGSVVLNGDGTIGYDPRVGLNHLAAGEVVEDSFTYTISDGNGGTDSATVRFDVTGINDAPTMSGQVSGSTVEDGTDAGGQFWHVPPTIGQLSANDVDSGAVLTWSVVGGGDTPLGAATVDQTGRWIYILDNGAADGLALGESTSDSFTVRVTDEHGASADRLVTIAIDGRNDAPVLVGEASQTAFVAELSDGAPGENSTQLQTAGAVAFTDADLSDLHGATVTPLGANYLGGFTLGTLDQGADSVGWSFSVADAALDALGGGETVTQAYQVSIADNHGGLATRTVSVVLVGSNDAAILSADSVIVVQGAAPASASGDLTIDDVDGPELFVAQTGSAGTYGSLSINAAGQWSYLAGSAYPGLAPGQSLTDTFVVRAADGTPTTVSVTISGSDDGGDARPDLFETDEATAIGAGLNLFADNGFGADSDADGALAIVAVNGQSVVGQTITLDSGALLRVNADGTFSYDPNDAFNALNRIPGSANQVDYDSFSYLLTDGSGSFALIKVNGVASPDDIILGQVLGNGAIFGTPGNDSFMLQPGGTASVYGLAGNDGFYFGAALANHHAVDGGSGADTIAVQGNYPGLTLGDGIVGVEVLLALSGSDGRFGDSAGNSYDYDIATIDANVAAGGVLTVQAAGLQPGEDLTFDGSAESDGSFRIFAGQGTDNLTGGAGNDGFFFGSDGNLTGADRIAGGAGMDSLALRGNYAGAGAVVFQQASLSGIEAIALLSGHSNEHGGFIVAAGFDYDLTLADGNVAAGQRLDVIALGLHANESVRFDARGELDGSVRILSGAGDDVLFGSANADTLYGGLGADAIDGGAGADLYLYRSAAESTAAARDSLVLGAGDRIDLSQVDADAGTGADDGFTFIGGAAFSGAAGQLRVVAQGGLWIVEGDVDGDTVADLMIAVSSPAPLTAADFIL